MNTKQLHYLEKGYGAFPYFIIRITGGLYKQIPIHFNQRELCSKEGVFVAVSETDLIEDIEKECLITLAKILAYDKEIIASGDLYLGDPRTHRRLTGCLVLEPERAIYIREDNEVIEGSIPWGGTLVSIENETIKFPMSHHYLLT